MHWNAGILDMPVWAFHGANDTVIAPRHSDEMVEKLRAPGKDATCTKVENVGHNVWENAYTEELLNWLLSKKTLTLLQISKKYDILIKIYVRNRRKNNDL